MVSLINFKTFDVDLNESQTISSSSGNVGRQTDTASSQRPQDKIAQSKQDRQANVKPDNSSHANGTAPQEEQQPKQQQLWHRQDMSAQEQYEAAGIKTSSRFSSTDAVVVVSDGGPNQDANLGDCCTGATAGYGYYCSRDEQHLATMDASKQQLVDGKPVASGQNYQLSISSSCSSSASSSSSSSASSSRHIAPPSSNKDVCSKNVAAAAASFTVTWRKLKFCIEPKWHERIASGSAALIGLASRANSTSSSPPLSSSSSSQSSTLQATKTTEPAPAATDCAQQTPAPTTTKPRIVLDQLDGSFKSGELTAILGPSGAGKTTLLDCLTGHRKSGLSGSVRFSIVPSTTTTTASSSSLCNPELGTPCGDCAAASAERQLASFAHRAHCAPKCEPQTRQKNLILATQQTGPGSCLSKQQQLQPHDHHRNSQTTTAAAAAEKLGCRLRKSPTPTTRLAATASSDMPMNGDNLKVSIIPQNDHLIGHLTVYETLNYASKMKNCFEGQFDHKLNVRRVAQQLGLMSCLGTRINKLSGGQYKRVSIAQELLSSPDVLILDEPTSGLDAMTCYQTVQVLKKLTEDCRASGEKSIAVILTIHQPNSDVFQQFNHVYVVAQGGKCIYEGPPASIESVINRVGICLPNSYYNPATMIVEIAAGKFGQEAISKLNAIQRKQYSESVPLVDEQNSTGDSAVDCPSSNYEDDDDDDNSSSGNNNKLTDASMKGGAGKINAGFEIDSELDADTNNNNNNNNNRQDHNKTEDNCCVPLEKQDRRRKRRRTRRRASEMATSGGADNNSGGQMLKVPAADSRSMTPSAVKILINGSDGGLCKGKGKGYGGGYGDGDSGDGNASDAGAGGGGGGGGHGGGRAEKRLKLNSLKADQKFPFWRHTYLHFHRSWLSIVRDPMLCSMQLALHIIVPVMVSLVYGTYVGKPNACPRAGPIDIMAYALEPTDTALQLQEDLRTTLENIGYIFFKLYGIIFAAMTVTVLTFPLDMHVLVKEFRNGWYGLSSYFLGRTLADIPFQLTLPLLAMSLSYYATGQPSSYLQWRFFSITAILILSSLIAQSQGLLFGAILMDKMKAAVFVAPAATTPIILFAGFLVRTQSIPSYLRPLSNLSYLRYAIEACLISRYGFNQCECDPAIFNQTVRELPPIARSMLDYWLSSYRPISDVTNGTLDMDMDNNSTAVAGPSALDAAAAANESMVANKPDLFTKLIDSLTRANSFGRNITSCEQVVPYPMIDYDLKDEQLFSCFAILLAMLIFTRLLTFFIVCYKVKRKV